MWYVIWTTTGQEEKCRDMIRRFIDPGLYGKCIIPYVERKEKRKGSWQLVRHLLFPSYLYIETDHPDELSAALSQEFGKLQMMAVLLGTDGQIVPLNDREEELLMKLIPEDESIKVSEAIEQGGKVVVVSGPLVGMEGVIRRIDRHKQIAVIEMQFLGRTLEARLGLHVVRNIENKEVTEALKEEG